jgi:hypothetical protein
MGVLIQAQVENIATRKDRTIKLTIGTQEMNPKQSSELFQLNNNLVNIYISPNQILSEAMSEIDKTSVDQVETIKSPSQRLKAVMYLNYHNNPAGFNDFDTYYKNKMEEIIKHFKNKLDENTI